MAKERAHRAVSLVIVGEVIGLSVLGVLAAARWLGQTPAGEKGALGAIGDSVLGPKIPPLPRALVGADRRLRRLRNPRIVVKKSEHVLSVYDEGELVKEYRCAVGSGRTDKTREGDRCTPEGRFYVCVKNPQSRHVLSLGLSYPNREDARRGLEDGLISRNEYERIVYAIDRGRRPPWNTELGGEIMIHGRGAGRDWTAGCVALGDDEIRELYPRIPIGTEVVIQP